MMMADRGLACNGRKAPERRAARKEARSLKPERTRKPLLGRSDVAASEVACESCETIDLVSNDYVEGSNAGGRHISHGSSRM